MKACLHYQIHVPTLLISMIRGAIQKINSIFSQIFFSSFSALSSVALKIGWECKTSHVSGKRGSENILLSQMESLLMTRLVASWDISSQSNSLNALLVGSPMPCRLLPDNILPLMEN